MYTYNVNIYIYVLKHVSLNTKAWQLINFDSIFSMFLISLLVSWFNKNEKLAKILIEDSLPIYTKVYIYIYLKYYICTFITI